MSYQRFNNNSRPDEDLYDLQLLNLWMVSGSDWTKIIREEYLPAQQQEIPKEETRSLTLVLWGFVVFLILYGVALIQLGNSVKTVAEQVVTQYVKQHTVN